ncbi:hypothetical protein MTBUT4_640011 [Magnetospirillum sp. UT-4]|nr:hypothetical protein MTBUT4_640011 [Magnetospirillum sp. UT-4]
MENATSASTGASTAATRRNRAMRSSRRIGGRERVVGRSMPRLALLNPASSTGFTRYPSIPRRRRAGKAANYGSLSRMGAMSSTGLTIYIPSHEYAILIGG